EVMPRAMAIAEEIASKSPPAIRLAKLGLNRTEEMNMKEGYEFECTLTAAVRRTPEAREILSNVVQQIVLGQADAETAACAVTNEVQALQN
ncbi:hypothetical protein LZ190_23430, partial [Rhodovulum sulfidophilum]|nr:hypothetical protein [Rhodovulum sulfidophilum]